MSHESEALDFEIPGLAKSRRALWVGLTMFAVSAIGSGGYLAYHGQTSPPAAAIGQMGPLPMGQYRIEADVEPLQRVEPQSAALDTPRPEVELEARAAEVEVDDPTLEVEADERVLEVEGEGRALEVEVEGVAAEVEVEEAAAEAEVNEQAFEEVTPQPSASAELSKQALAKLGKGRYKVARELALQATAADSSNAEGWIVLGAARQGLRDRAGARGAYKTCAQLNNAKYSRECRRMLR